jgi:hypothetical protein
MIVFLRVLFALIAAAMTAIAGWATFHQSLGGFAHSPTFREPWVLATLADAYLAFITFYVWVAWKEQSLAARGLWLVAIILLGNMAMSAYMLAQLFAVPASGRLDEVFTRRQPGKCLLPAILAAVGVATYALA